MRIFRRKPLLVVAGLKITPARRRILAVLLDAPSAGLPGSSIGTRSRMGYNVVVANLATLEASEWVCSAYEIMPLAWAPGRRMYRLTEVGRDRALCVIGNLPLPGVVNVVE